MSTSKWDTGWGVKDHDGEDVPEFNVFTRSGDVLRHFWGGEMGPQTADPGQDPRGAADIMPLWTVLDMTPGGRGTDWYPKLEYETVPGAPDGQTGQCHCDSHT